MSAKSWSSFAIAALVLLLFAFLSVRQLRLRDTSSSGASAPTIEENSAIKTPAKQTHIAEKAPDRTAEVAPEQAQETNDKEAASEQNAVGPEITVKDLIQAWNKGDAERVARLFLPDGVLRLPTGSEIQSRDNIKKVFAEERSGRLKDTRLTNTVDDVSTPSAETAAVKGTYQIEGLKVLGFKASTTGSYMIEQAKRDGRWLIAKAALTRE